ncbi:MAG TPA: TonB-dependent receptor [Pyrinomonadaceae bacterium]|jgi:outer membrane receptor protein involved in Fe transport
MKKVIIFLSFIFFLFSADASAQTTGSVSGTIRDAAGAAIAGADVSLLSAQQLVLRSATSDAAGNYRFENVAAGSYVVQAAHASFSPQRQAVQINSSAAATVDLVLEINTLTANVTVTAETNTAADKNNIPAQINVITEDAISQRATAVLAQVADEEPGVSLQRTSPTIGAVLVRGLTEVGVYVDGVRYTNSTQRGGINTFFNLNEPTSLRTVEIQRSPNTAQFGSDGLGGNVQLVSRQPVYGMDTPEWHGEYNSFFNSADRSFGSNALVSYGTKRFGILGNLNARRVNTLRPGGGIDSHSAITRFLGLPSDITGSERLPDTAFTQYGGTFQFNFAPTDDQQISFRYQRSQQDGGKRYDQLLGGDGNLIADLRNLMLDFGYLRYYKQGVGFFDSLSATVSYNSQREERVNQGGQGNPLGAITNDKERTTTWGASFFLDKQFARNNFLVGGDFYRDKVNAPSFNTDPASGVVALVRPRVPNGAKYDLFGVYVQDAFEAIPNRLRLSGALRYNVGVYKTEAADAPVVNGQPLFPDDSARFKDFSGRLGAVFSITDGLNAAFNFSRGFRAPNITSLGSLGLVGVGFQVSTSSVAALGATIGTTADATAVSTGIEVAPLRSEISNNYEASLRYRNKRFEASLTGFLVDYADTIVRQTLILPPGAVGLQLGSQTITNQNANGAVFVPLSTSPVLVQANFSDTRMRGAELAADYRFSTDWLIGGNFSYVYAEDRATELPPNLGGGVPPALGFLRLRYQPAGRPFWIEGYANFAGRQDRLSTLDLSDRRTGGARSRAQIQNFFRRGACVRGLTTPGTNGQCGSAGGILLATGETLAQVQNRLLPLGATINGVFIANNDTAVPLFASIPGYALFNVRGGYRFDERQEITVDFENIGDKSHRLPGWGIDGPGRSLRVAYRFRF